MAKRKENQTDVVQAAQSQPPENEAPEESEMLQNPEPEAAEQDDLEIMQNQKANAEKPPTFVIICRNKINKMIGGVSFVDGIGYTSDGFTASWFGNKEGYEVGNNGL